MEGWGFFNNPHIREQALWRLSQVQEKSPECLKEDTCKKCGCAPSEMVYSDYSCEGNCYPDLMDAESWDKFKANNNIQYDDNN